LFLADDPGWNVGPAGCPFGERELDYSSRRVTLFSLRPPVAAGSYDAVKEAKTGGGFPPRI